MTRAVRIAVMLVVAGLTGCAALDPFPATPQPAAAKVKDAGPRVAICYDFAVSSTTAVQKAAQDQCAPNTHAVRVATDWMLDFCPVLLPARATFVCTPQKIAR
jgi:hypothetical protein